MISNAIKYSPFNTEIYVGLVLNNLHVTVEIKDNGPGLSEADMKRVFGKFERLSALPTAGEASTGLGLAIVKDLVTLLNGSVSVQSEHGKGASFFVTLPLSDTQNK
ncbi:MAG: sensor histidine kinase [Ignavibacteriales bacterium]|nr:sensor histidine kinase [Ignavibacteriales bacterium]